MKVAVAKGAGRRALAVPQATFDQDHREIAQHIGLGAARELELRGKPPEHASHPSMYPPVKYPDQRWGMTVDLDRCTGCQACVVACVTENNVPVVGREQVAYGRDQHWLRLERWEEGPAAHPENIFLPMFCQHCGVAPCEPVCPVYAAYHTRDGLNAPGLQPLRGHAVLRQQLPLPRAPLQLVLLPVAVAAGSPAQSRRHRAPARGHGEVHHVRPAHHRGQGPGARRGPAAQGRRDPHRVPADLPHPGHHLRRPQGRQVRGGQAVALARAAITSSRSWGRARP